MREDTETERVLGEIPAKEQTSPALVLHATDARLGSVARFLLEADQHDLFTFVVLPDADGSQVGALADSMGAVVLELGRSGSDPPFETAERVARVMGFPGVLYCNDANARIDFSRCESVASEADSYGVEAPVVEDGRTGDVVAAIPTYNEEETIESVVNDVRRHVDEVLVVDDGSTDDTVAVAQRTPATVVEHETNRGYGAALKTAFRAANERNASALVVLDGDGQHEPQDVPKLLEEQRETGANVVVGSRFHDENTNVPFYRRVGLFVINALTNLSLGISPTRSWVTDTQSGFRAYDEQAIQSLATDGTLSDNMSASTDILYHARRMDYDVAEVGTTIYYEGGETSTQNPLVHGLTVVGNILRTVEHERPLTFLGIPGLIGVLLGAGLGYWAVVNYVQSGTFPTGIVLFCVFSTVIGSLLSITSIILHSVKTQVNALVERPMEG